MKSRTTKRFRKNLSKLPRGLQEQAEKAYEQWKSDPSHPSLEFKRVHPSRPFYSARISRGHRVVGRQRGEYMIWFWIGPHDEYIRILSDL